MNRTIIAVAVSAAVVVTSGYAQAGSYENHFGGQEGVNKHLQGSINDMQDFDHHLQGSINDDRKRIGAVEAEAANNTAWNDRQEGVIRQNRGRLDDNDAMNQRQNDSIDNAHARIGGVKDQADKDRARIDGNEARSIGNQQQLGVTDSRSINNAERLDGAEGAIRETNAQQTVDRAASVARDNRIESESIERDNTLSGRIDYNAAVNHAYQQQTAEQFAQHDQAISNERDERREADQDLKAGVASAVAIGSHHFDTNYRGLQMSIAGGFYDGENAQSLSLGGALSDNVFGSVAASTDSRGRQAYSVQSTFKF